ncbi:hypothetical protein [Streptomyces spectabilis]|uniref:Uncharacterized protein n=1 Tax=Streptomyces spectabilis TaxID=68270 RepID=A0A7W8EXL4_STRST|nr:hypothetical protein [Streptomyces spectabilis]MBB5109197.1 hypothetical protein [Streptomyces spectabilis]MCI3907753.1 hypothetical protein [Streptomyces spectabilis]
MRPPARSALWTGIVIAKILSGAMILAALLLTVGHIVSALISTGAAGLLLHLMPANRWKS